MFILELLWILMYFSYYLSCERISIWQYSIFKDYKSLNEIWFFEIV